jgi:thioredoxin 1
MMKIFARAGAAALALTSVLAGPAFAADAMKKDAMAADAMKHEAMGKDAMGKDAMGKDAMSHDAMGKDAMMMAPHFIAYTDAAFDAAQKAGKPMVVAIAADWCPVCKGQEVTLNKLMAEPAYAKTTFFRVDFDAQKPAVTKFGAKMQSTLIAYKGSKEVGRIAYTADKAKVMALAAKAKAS